MAVFLFSCEKDKIGTGVYYYAENYINRYYDGGVALKMLEEHHYGNREPMILQTGFVIAPSGGLEYGPWYFDSYAKEQFLKIAERNGDTSFNRKVFNGERLGEAFADNFRELHIVSDADWDEEHPAGKPLDDLFRVSVRSWKQRDEYGAPLLCRERMDRIGPEHLQMIPFNPKNPWNGRKNLRPIEIEPLAEPASERHHRLTLTMTTADGRTKSASIDYPPKTGL